MTQTTKCINYIHNKPEIKNLRNFLDQGGISVAYYFRDKVNEFLSFKGESSSVTNKDRIFSKYTLEEKHKYKDDNSDSLPLKPGTILKIPLNQARRDLLVAEGYQIIDNTSTVAFMAEKLRDLLDDPNYSPVNKLNTASISDVKQIHPHLSVWVWSRALSGNSGNKGKELEGTLMDMDIPDHADPLIR